MSSGGAERVTSNLANYWAGRGWEITIVTLASQNDDFFALNPSVKRIALKLNGDSSNALIGLMQNLRRVYVLRQVLRQIQPDIALGMMDSANVLLAIASWGLKQIRTIGSERTYPPQHPLGVVWEKLRLHSYAHMDAVVAQTDKGAEWLKSHTGAKRVFAIPNSVNWPLPNQLPIIEVENVCGMGRKVLLAMGRLSGEKQFGLLVACFCSLASRYSDWDLVILGEGSLRSELEVHVLEVGMTNRVFLPGRAGNVGDWYNCADIYVMSSRFEGFPNTLVEAMASGLPVVSFDCDTGPGDIIRQGLDGLLVPPGDVVGLTAALDRLMSDAVLRQSFSKRAVEVRERFSMERIAGMWESLFKEVRK